MIHKDDKWIAERLMRLIIFNDNYWFVFTEMNSPLTDIWHDIQGYFIDENDNLWIAEDGLLKFDGNWTSYNTGNSAYSNQPNI